MHPVPQYTCTPEQLNFSSLVTMPPPPPQPTQSLHTHQHHTYMEHPRPTPRFQQSHQNIIPKQTPVVPMPMGQQSTVHTFNNQHIVPKFSVQVLPPYSNSCVPVPVQSTNDVHVQYVPFYLYYPVPVPCAAKTSVEPAMPRTVEPVQELFSDPGRQSAFESEISISCAESRRVLDDMEACEAGSVDDNEVIPL